MSKFVKILSIKICINVKNKYFLYLHVLLKLIVF